MRTFKYGIGDTDMMKFKEFFYYTLIFLFSVAILYVLVFKTELLVGRWFIGGIVGIIYIILKQLYNLIKENGRN
jgi:hypothetical protein